MWKIYFVKSSKIWKKEKEGSWNKIEGCNKKKFKKKILDREKSL